ncbi:hypothetical protein M569_14777 [Genlisea aurea]|uniref:Glutathione S-transferase n=1 Tax=Genlisea aurea TaxID=192259 RepID=S8DKJ3_9LAMI|nr:hypothetical protein M569_14777 [Genlisea aurea]
MAAVTAAGDVKLLGLWASPFVMRARIALKIKSIEYEYQEEDLSNKSELLLNSNPVHKAVPVLIHRGRPVSESLVIIQYLDEVWPSEPQILPADPFHRARARFWASFVDEKWGPATRSILLTAEGEERKKRIEESREALGVLEEAFINGGGKFFGGESLGLVDIAAGSIVPWARVIGEIAGVNLIDGIKNPHLHDWARRFTSDSAVEDLSPEHRALAAYADKVFPKIATK